MRLEFYRKITSPGRSKGSQSGYTDIKLRERVKRCMYLQERGAGRQASRSTCLDGGQDLKPKVKKSGIEKLEEALMSL